MKAVLWQIDFQSQRYSGERYSVTVNAPNIKKAIEKAEKKQKEEYGGKLDLKHKRPINYKFRIEKVEWIASED